MKRFAGIVAFALLAACSHTVVVPVPPRVDLKGYSSIGIVEFDANSERSISARATRQFQEQIQAAQPGTRFIELGEHQALLAALGARQLDAPTLRKIGQQYGVAAVFLLRHRRRSLHPAQVGAGAERFALGREHDHADFGVRGE